MEVLLNRPVDARQRFERHLELTARYIHEGRQADKAVLDGDLQTMPDFVAIRNRQSADLNLCLVDNVPALLERIKAMPPAFRLRCVLSSPMLTDCATHHLYVDIAREADSPLSFLVVESASVQGNRGALEVLLQLLIKIMSDPFFSRRRISCFNAQVQKSGSDCLIYAIDFALKAHRYASAFAALHAEHRNGRAVGNDGNNAAMERNNQDTFSVAPAFLLPADFCEHAQSATALEQAWGAGSDPDLIDRIAVRTQVLRAAANAPSYVPPSIEHLRRKFLREAIAALANRP
ncbi:MAG: PipA/GogA/GtgA family type secretion system effector [Herbaspirillum sp.]|jgi:YopJ family protease|nr:PipA/GogA/GtgA family type secretion system effector [Herbaspirillum sp.]